MATSSSSASMSRKPVILTDSAGRLTFGIQNPAALFAGHDFLAAPHSHRRRRSHFHMTTGADIVFERDDCGIALTREQPIESIE